MSTTSTSVRPLPVELYSKIFDQCDNQRTLYSLLLTCKGMHSEVERLLYFHFESEDIDSQVSFYRRVTECDRVSRYVVKFTVAMTETDQGNEEYYTLLNQALSSLINLKFLSFRNADGLPSSRILRNCTFQLRYLDWGCHSDEVGLSAFLETQPDLELASLRWYYSGRPFPASAMKQLRCLNANSGAIQTVLPRRKIERLHWMADSDESGMVLDLGADMIAALQNLRVLIYGGHYPQSPLRLIVDRLSNLRTLVFAGKWEDNLDSVEGLAKLKRLILLPEWSSRVERTEEDIKALVYRAFSLSPSLEYIFNRNGAEDDRGAYLKWVRDSKKPVAVNSASSGKTESRGVNSRTWLGFLSCLELTPRLTHKSSPTRPTSRQHLGEIRILRCRQKN